MKYFRLLLTLLLFYPDEGWSQKEDYQWPLGTYAPWCNTCLYLFYYDFNTDPPSIVLRNDTVSTNNFMATYCDQQGVPLLFSNGLQVFDKDGNPLEEAYGLNPSLPEIQTYRSYFVYQSGFFLADPGNPDLVHLIHMDWDQHPAHQPFYTFMGKNLMVTTLDLPAKKAVSKNRVLLEGTLQTAAATRHANGRDWWIVVPDADTSRYHIYILTPDGFRLHAVQDIGTKPDPVENEQGVICATKFSPSGRYLVDVNATTGFSVYHFDRCAGLLYGERRVDYDNSNPGRLFYGGGGGADFSPDDRFLYITSTQGFGHPAFPPDYFPFLFQYDLTAPDLATAVDTLNEQRGFHPYEYEQLLGSSHGPDGRIYITYLGGSYCTVQYPNRKGKAALFRYDNPDFKNNIYRGIPYLPNYRLGPLDGSSCDTLGLNNVPVAYFRMDTPDSSDLQGKLFYDLSHHEPAWWRWDFGDGTPMASDTSPMHRYAQPGRYRVCLTVGNAYGLNTYCREVFIGITAIGEADSEVAEGLLFAPNPAQGRTTLYVSESAGAARGELLLFDALGRLALRARLQGQLTELDLGNLLPGVYGAQVLRPGRPVLRGKLLVGGG